MARSFSDSDKERLRQQMFGVARDLFTRQGLKKTSLDELTQPLGIAKSSFYLLFESKEALYLELLAQDGPAIRTRIQNALDTAPTARAGIVAMLTEIVRELETNALTRRMLTHPEELRQLAARVSPEELAASNQSGLDLLVPYLKKKQRAGEIIAGDAVLYARVISAVTLLTLHRDQIGGASYPQVMAAMIDFVAIALTTTQTLKE